LCSWPPRATWPLVSWGFTLVSPVCSILSYLAGLGWFLGLASSPFTLRTYMSENAMGSTMVEEQFVFGERALSYAREFAGHKKKVGGIPVAWLEKTMWNLGLEVYKQPFSRTLPFPDETRERYVRVGAARPAVPGSCPIPAPGGGPSQCSTESCGSSLRALAGHRQGWLRPGWGGRRFLFSPSAAFPPRCLLALAPWAPGGQGLTLCPAAAAHGLGHGAGLRAQPADPAAHGAEAGLRPAPGRPRPLPALLHSHPAASLLSPPGLREGRLQRTDWDTVPAYVHSLQTLLLMVLKQGSGRPQGDHGLFLRYHIEAITLRGINSFRQYKYDMGTVGK
uniref:Uncharacterized protein n=1 Tax=Pelodiscus sinensis TaxID=13735 RepID=K7GE62_PELSI